MPERKRLSAQDWVDAAVAALGSGGVAAVAVEPLAARLGATKGSFYWHFANREALLGAALAHWERTATDDVIAVVEAEPDARSRLHRLMGIALGGDPEHPGERMELALLATADHPLVAPVLERVTARRLDYLQRQFVELGFPAAEARRRGLLAYTAYLGHAQLAHATAAAVPHGPDLAAYVDSTIDLLTAGREWGTGL
jgi:AcrR family transcriptional regulator